MEDLEKLVLAVLFCLALLGLAFSAAGLKGDIIEDNACKAAGYDMAMRHEKTTYCVDFEAGVLDELVQYSIKEE
jgi:hypothetical protein